MVLLVIDADREVVDTATLVVGAVTEVGIRAPSCIIVPFSNIFHFNDGDRGPTDVVDT